MLIMATKIYVNGAFFKEHEALCDLFRNGSFWLLGTMETVACKVGYIDGGDILEAYAVFIPEQITREGTQIEKETVILNETNRFEVEDFYPILRTIHATRFDLKPVYANRASHSFYGKAKVIVTPDVIALQSYETIVCEIERSTGKVHRTWDAWSATTGKHLHEFALLMEENAITSEAVYGGKSEWMKRPYEEVRPSTAYAARCY